MTKILRHLGVSSDIAYLGSILSIGASVAVWLVSRNFENAPGEKADRWRIHVGLWAPTYMALGNALKLEQAQRPVDGDQS
jgi:hypothetical protein